MSSISPDGGYRYTQRAVSEIEDEMRAEQKARVHRDEAAVNRIEDNYKESVGREKARADEAIEAAKQAARDDISRERFNLKQEAEQLRKQTYDRMGRYNGEEASVLKDQLTSTQRAREAEAEKYHKSIESTEENYRKRSDESTRDHQVEMAKAAESVRANVVGPYEDYVAKQKQLASDERQKAIDQYTRLDQQRMEELETQRKRTDRAVTEVQQDYDHRAQKLENDRDERIVKSAQRSSDRAYQDIERQRDSHAAETADLRDMVKETVIQTKAESKARAEREYEDVTGRAEDARKEQKRMVDGYETELDAMKYKHNIAENYFHRRSGEVIREKEGYFSGLLQKQQQESHQSQREIQKDFDRNLGQAEDMRKHEAALASARLTQALENASGKQQTLLENQAKNYTETMANQKTMTDEQITVLQKELRRNLSATTLQDVTPAQENAVRKSLVREYEDKFNTDNERNRGTIDSIQRNYADRLTDTVDQKDQEKAQMARRNAEDSTRDRAEFLGSVREVEENRAQAIKDVERQSTRTVDDMQRMYASAMDKQRRNYEELIEKLRSEGSLKLAETRRDMQYDKTVQLREAQNRQAEMTRELERKMSEQSAVYQDQIEDLKSRLVKERDELVKQSSREIEDQRKSFEHQIAAMADQHKERERFLSANHEEAADRMRRAHQAQMKAHSRA